MNDDELRDRLHAAVRDVRPRSRYDELVSAHGQGSGGAGEPPSSDAGHDRARRLLAVAAAVVVLALAAALVVALTGRDDDPGPVQATPPHRTTTTAPAERREGGARISVLASALPDGWHHTKESSRVMGDSTSTIARFEDPTVTGVDAKAAPFVRVILDEGEGVGERSMATRPGQAPAYRIDGRPVYRRAPDLLPPPVTQPGGGVAVQGLWDGVQWAQTPDRVVIVQGRDVPRATIDAIARSVQVTG